MKPHVELTAKQEKVLKFIRERVGERLPPTIREIAGEMGFSSTGTVRDYLEALRKKGYLKRENNKSRAIKLLDNGAGIPVIGSTKNMGRVKRGQVKKTG
ncbi:MAG: FaeA/PapI family transcriptional regulator [Candidatus Omnitrophica bacterium]|nr:FaeA/PapI family transcriptional regulator [Candidatus Omnitrophota bacterium]MDD5551294.1 FaeA/PapI family transcriptional regulator [Candidatus Omnitrophota bacterium]